VSTSKIERAMFTLTQRMDQARSPGRSGSEINELGITQSDGSAIRASPPSMRWKYSQRDQQYADLLACLGARMAMVVPMLARWLRIILAAEGAAKVNALLPSEIAQMTEYRF